jgi:hypothetical protein
MERRNTMGNRNRALLKLLRHSLVILACLLCLSQSGFSGELSDFEQDATRNGDNKNTESSEHKGLNGLYFGISFRF